MKIMGTRNQGKGQSPEKKAVPVKRKSKLAKQSGPGCSKLMLSLVNISLNFQKLVSQICQYFLLKKCEKLLHFSQFFNKKY